MEEKGKNKEIEKKIVRSRIFESSEYMSAQKKGKYISLIYSLNRVSFNSLKDLKTIKDIKVS